MNPQLLIHTLQSRDIPHELIERELSVRCPRCRPQHDIQRRRLTLSINVHNFKFYCPRCSPPTTGRGLKSFFKLFGIPYDGEDTGPLIVSERYLDFTGAFNEPPPEPLKIPLPEEFRQDWNRTITGQMVLRYLQGRLSKAAIRASGVGYAVSGRAAGCAIFPVRMNGELWFWQARIVAAPGNSKYVNPRSAPKSHVLYGYDWLRGDAVVLVEGVFDALSTPNAVALFGKTISQRQIELLDKKKISDVTVMLDSDAYSSAEHIAQQIVRRLYSARGRVRIALLKEGEDPATLTNIAGYVDQMDLRL